MHLKALSPPLPYSWNNSPCLATEIIPGDSINSPPPPPPFFLVPSRCKKSTFPALFLFMKQLLFTGLPHPLCPFVPQAGHAWSSYTTSQGNQNFFSTKKKIILSCKSLYFSEKARETIFSESFLMQIRKKSKTHKKKLTKSKKPF